MVVNRRPTGYASTGLAPSVEHYTLVDTALAQAMSRIRLARRGETILSRLAYGRVLAEDVHAPADVPPFPTSHWDGYAVVSEDLHEASDSNPVSLKVVGAADPGRRAGSAISRGEALRVATGAPMPTGADAVAPVESTQVDGKCVLVRHPVQPGSHVYGAGEDARRGETILRKGQVIRVQDLGLLTAMGLTRAKVWRRPRVSVLATGSELTGTDRPRPGKVLNSHSPVFLRLCERLGCVPVDLGIARDNRAEISAKLRSALLRSDFVLTLGGTSAGRRDCVSEAVETLDPDLLLHGIRMDRGRVTGLAVVRGKPLLMMPGPIQGAMNAFLLLGLPIIEVLSGSNSRETEVPSSLHGAWEARRKYADFRKVVYVKLKDGREAAEPLSAETESMRILANADGYVVVPENVTQMDAGDRVTVRLLPGVSFA